jgi:tetratricopeptide (TPR) repeat protein
VSMLAAKSMFAAGMALFVSGQTVSAQTVSEKMAAHAQAAHAAEQRSDFSTAAREYEYLARMLPRSAEMQSNLGVALYFDHQWDRAIAVFRRAIAINPTLLAPHLFSGVAWYQLSKPDAAVPELEKAIHINASDVIAHTWLGYAYVAQSRYEAAATEFEEACRLAPDNIDAWYALGQSYLQIGKLKTVELLTLAPDGGRIWQLAGEQFRLQGNQGKAREDFEQAHARRPDIAELRDAVIAMGGKPVSDANVQQHDTQREDALYQQAHDAEQKSHAAFERVVSIAPDSYRAHQVMAYAFVTQQNYDKAIAEYRLVLQQRPDLPGVHEAIGTSLLRSGKTDEALAEFESERQIQPHSASASTSVGQALLIAGKFDAAGKILQEALQMDRPPPEIYRLLGKIELHRQNYQAAVNNLTRYVSSNKDDASAYYLLSRAYRGLGDRDQTDRALARFQKTSQDVKARKQAIGELEHLDDQARMDDDAKKTGSTPENF